jgi:molecular chaperone DnaK
MYKQGDAGAQQGQPEAAQAEGDNVQDVDFEEVK